MKVRNDFVTNSSSSSFIIAKKDTCTVEEIKNNVQECRKEIVKTLEMFDMESDERAINTFVKDLSEKLFEEASSLRLGDWTVSAVEYSNECDELESFVYDYGYMLGTENFKVG